jgi:hypothetical protein
MKPAALAAQRAPVFVDIQIGGAEGNPGQFSRQAIRAELRGNGLLVGVGVYKTKIEKPKPETAPAGAAFDDDIPFAPEWRG